MWDCLKSTRDLYDAFRLVPVESYPSLTIISILHLALAIIKAMRLLCIEDDAWDLHTVRNIYNLPDMLQQLSRLFDAANCRNNPRCRIVIHGRPIFSDYAESYRGIERHYLSMVSPDVAHSMMEPITTHGGEEFDLEFWNQLSYLTYGLTV